MTDSAARVRAQLRWLQALREPSLVLGWSLPEWERVVRVARPQRLLARLGMAIEQASLLDAVPVEPRRHLISSMRISRWRMAQMTWALERVVSALGDAPYPRVLLKGAAYVAQSLPIAMGRLPSDVDVLFPKAALDAVVPRLARAGWAEAKLDEHDRRYYYEWSHEIPPMTHPLHGIELDVHHNILPPVARTQVDADRLLARVQPSPWNGWCVLHPVDQVLHCASHLFLDSEARVRLRDLVDLDGLMRHFGREASFWDDLPGRAVELGLAEPLALALHFCVRWLETPVPELAVRSVERAAPRGPSSNLLVALWSRSLRPVEPDIAAPWGQEAAATLLLARYHHRRMPLRLLLPHLWHKTGGRPPANEEGEPRPG